MKIIIPMIEFKKRKAYNVLFIYIYIELANQSSPVLVYYGATVFMSSLPFWLLHAYKTSFNVKIA